MRKTEQKYEELRQEFVAHKQAFQDKSKSLLLNMFKDFFQVNPDVSSFSWRQYTPYFNDGDECVFRRCEIESLMLQDDQEVDDYQDSRLKEANEMLSIFDKDSMRSIFGDHKEITVFRNGTASVEEYEHD